MLCHSCPVYVQTQALNYLAALAEIISFMSGSFVDLVGDSNALMAKLTETAAKNKQYNELKVCVTARTHAQRNSSFRTNSVFLFASPISRGQTSLLL